MHADIFGNETCQKKKTSGRLAGMNTCGSPVDVLQNGGALLATAPVLGIVSCYHSKLLLLLQPFNGLFSRTTWVSRYQKGKTNLDFTGARDSE